MRKIFLTGIQTFFLDIVMWVIFHLSIGYWSSRIPVNLFNPESLLFKTRKWEKNGLVYEKVFKIRSWKDHFPSGAAFYQDAYEIQHIDEFSIENVRTWILESCRSEFCDFPGLSLFPLEHD
mgnify:FL=1